MRQPATDFAALELETMLDAVEAALDRSLVGFAQPLPSYINRVYELQAADETRFIAKFYRPGRWTAAALADEHRFILDCAAAEIPVVAPLRLQNGATLGHVQGIAFAVYPKRSGRVFEAVADEDWRRLGRIIGRLHAVGSRTTAEHRTVLLPAESTARCVAHLHEGGFVPPRSLQRFRTVTAAILQAITPAFAGCRLIRVHGDCHRGNIMDRIGEGLLLIDFDDMAMGPPVQDLWMLLPDRPSRCPRELELILDGYRTFSEFPAHSVALIEPLRAMRMLYFLAWCSRQVDDLAFTRNFPDWGTDAFWRRELDDLEAQLDEITGAFS